MTASLAIISQDDLVWRIQVRLQAEPQDRTFYSTSDVAPKAIQPALFTLIVGAGFSCKKEQEDDVGLPLVDELMKVTIGDYYYFDQDQTSMKRNPSLLRTRSAEFWEEFNLAAMKGNLPIVELDSEGLPKDPGAAYQYFFDYRVLNLLFQPDPKKLSWVKQLIQQRAARQAGQNQEEQHQDLGERFARGFLRYLLSPGAEFGYGATGRNDLNEAHIYLAALLEAQQLGELRGMQAFCRNILTTNFDTLLQNCLQMVNLLYRLTDRPEKGLHRTDFFDEEGPIHLVYIHGSILRYNPASSLYELDRLEISNQEVLREYLESRDILIIGYSGWKDGLMAALQRCNLAKHQIYWCDVRSQPSPHVADFLKERGESSAYVHLNKEGAGSLMRALYQTLVPRDVQRDPIQRYGAWRNLTWNLSG